MRSVLLNNKGVRFTFRQMIAFAVITNIILFALSSFATFTFSSSSGNDYVTLNGIASGQKVSVYSTTGSIHSTGISAGSSLNLFGTLSITNGGFNTDTTGWACLDTAGSACTTFAAVTSSPILDGAKALQADDNSSARRAIAQQAVTIIANTEYTVTAYARDDQTDTGGTLRIRTDSYTGGSDICTTTDTVSNQNVWTKLTCIIPSSNTDTSVYIQLLDYQDIDDSQYWDQVEIVGIGPFITGTYFLHITDTDGQNFLDNSNWETLTKGDTWTWSDSSLTCRSDVASPAHANCGTSWGFEERGSSGAWYRTLKKNATSDYVLQSLPLGSNLASGKHTFTSGSYFGIGTNMSFESGVWTGAYGTCASGCVVDTGTKADGAQSLKIPYAAPYNLMYNGITGLTGSTTYTVWVRIKNNLTGGNALVKFETPDCYTMYTSTSNNAWTWYSGVCTTNPGQTSTNLIIGNISATAGDVWFDSIHVCQGNNVRCDGMGANITDGSMWNRWYHASSTGFITVDLGSSQTFNAIQLAMADHEGYGYNAYKISGSADNSSFTEILTGTRLQYDNSLWIYFADKTYRYIKIEATSVYTRPELWEVKVFNINGGNATGDIDELYAHWAGGASLLHIYNGVTYDSRVTNGDGSVTYTKTYSAYGGNLVVDTTYKKVSENAWKKTIKITVPNTAESWRVAVRNGLIKNTTEVKHRVHSDGAGTWVTEDHTDYGDMGVGEADYRVFQFATLCDPQCYGIVADDGWNAKWVIYSDSEPAGSKETMELTGTYANPVSSWKQSYNNYGKQENGLRYITVAGNSSVELNTYYFYSDDPSYMGTAPYAYIAFMDGKGYSSLDVVDKIFTGASFQSIRIRDTTQQATQWVSAAAGYESQGQWNDSLYAAMGVGNQGIAERMLNQYRQAASYQPILYTDTFISSADYNWWSGLNFAAYCKSRFNTSISASEVRTRVDALLSTINANGESIGSDYGDDSYINTLMTPDMYIRVQMMTIQELRSGKYLLPVCGTPPCWSSSDETKLSNAITALRSLYDATNKYIHFSKYGHWYREPQGSASGGNHYISSDYVYAEGATGETGAIMRFVVPSGHTNAALVVHYEKNSDNGRLIVKKTGTPVTQSPIEQYNASQTFTSTAITETVSTGDVLTFIVSSAKHASSTGYITSIDKLVIGGTSYEEDNANWTCAGGWVDCSNGRSLGWKTWKDQAWVWLFELIYRNTFNESMFNDAQLTDHFEQMHFPDLSNGSFGGYNQMGNNDYVPTGYYLNDAAFNTRGQYHRGGDGTIFSLSAYKLLDKYLNAEIDMLKYRFQEDSSLITYAGTWSKSSHIYSANNKDTAFPDGDQYKYSSTTNDYVQFSFKGSEITWLATKSSGYGTADVYFCSGSGCTPTSDTTGISLSNGSTIYKQAVYTKTGLAYGDHTIKVIVASGININIDSFVVKTKSSWLESLRKNLEIAIRPVSHEYICTESDLLCYGDSATLNRRDSNAWNNYYRGGILVNYPKFRGMFQGIYHRRIN